MKIDIKVLNTVEGFINPPNKAGMTDETTPKTAEEYIFTEDLMGNPTIANLSRLDRGLIGAMAEQYTKLKMRSVAQQVRQQCAQEAMPKVENIEVEPSVWEDVIVVDKESILSVDIEQFLT